MVSHDDRDSPELVDAAAQSRQRHLSSEQALRGDATDTEDHVRSHELDLPAQIRQALRGFLLARIAVVRRPALQHVRDVHLAALEPGGRQHRIQELARAPDERLALAVLFGAGRLADHHQARPPVAGAEHGLRARFAEPAAPAISHGGLERGPVEAFARASGAARDPGGHTHGVEDGESSGVHFVSDHWRRRHRAAVCGS